MSEPDNHSIGDESIGSGGRGTTGQFRPSWQEYNYPSTAIVKRVSDVTGLEMTALPALHEAVDPDALDALLGTERTSIRLSFRYAGTTVSIGSDQPIEVRLDGENG